MSDDGKDDGEELEIATAYSDWMKLEYPLLLTLRDHADDKTREEIRGSIDRLTSVFRAGWKAHSEYAGKTSTITESKG